MFSMLKCVSRCSSWWITCSYLIIWKLKACVVINVDICCNMAYLALFMYIGNRILANGWNFCLLCSYWRITVNLLLVDIYMNMCWVFLVKVVFWVSRVSFRITRKVVSLTYTPCTHLTWGIKLHLEVPWTMLSRIGLVLRAIREGLGLKEIGRASCRERVFRAV